MRFTTHVTEADFMAAYRLLCKSRHRQIASAIAYVFAAAFWSFLLCAAISERTHPGDHFWAETHPSSCACSFREPSSFSSGFLRSGSTFLLPHAASFVRREPLHGEILNEVTSEGLWQKTSGGSYGFSQWQDFSFWRESERIIIVIYPTNLFCLLPKSDLNSDQCAELRAILASALPQK